jgi:rhodanese-related sulfurtransferase
MTTVFRQAAGIFVVGAALSLAANAVSPYGLKLTRDYFPAARVVTTLPPVETAPGQPPATNDPFAAITAKLRAHGLQAVMHDEVARLFQSPEAATHQVLFLDARNDQHYQAGHLPGAWQFDHYRPDQHLPNVLPACLLAAKIIVYCTGGDCEDSEFAARMLTQSGVPADRLFIYPGGITEWRQRGLPVETGPRGSGLLLPTGQ